MTDPVALEAIEVIQQLRAEIERLRAMVHDDAVMLGEQGREIERLTAALMHNSEWRDENIRVWAEIERLRAALLPFADRTNWYDDGVSGTEWTGPDEPWVLARAALEQP